MPSGVEIEIHYGGVIVKGPRGTINQNYHPEVTVKLEQDEVLVERLSERKFHHSLHGLTRSLIANAVTGVTEGYTKTMELMGVGYRVQQNGEGITLNVGYSHPVGQMIRGLKRVSKPGLRVYVGKGEIPRVYGGLGVAVVSTSEGLMSGHQAWRKGIGGELLCYVW